MNKIAVFMCAFSLAGILAFAEGGKPDSKYEEFIREYAQVLKCGTCRVLIVSPAEDSHFRIAA